MQKALEKAYAAEAGFDVPTIVFTAAEVAAVSARAAELHAEHQPSGQHYVTLYATAPSADAAQAVHDLAYDGETCVVDGRAAHALLDGGVPHVQAARLEGVQPAGPGDRTHPQGAAHRHREVVLIRPARCPRPSSR